MHVSFLLLVKNYQKEVGLLEKLLTYNFKF